MIEHNKDSILGKIISLTEKLEGSHLEQKALDNVKSELNKLCNYLAVDDVSAIFFSIIFVLQNQRECAVTLHDIAEFLGYSFLYILEYRKNLNLLEETGLIKIQERKNVSPHPENNGYVIHGTIMNNVIDNEPILKLEKGEDTTESIFGDIQEVQHYYMENEVMDFYEYKRQIITLEKKYSKNKVLANIKKLFPEDFDSRSFLYYFCIALMNGSEFLDACRRGMAFETRAFYLMSPKDKNTRKKNLLIEKNDILLTEDFLQMIYVDNDDFYRGKKLLTRTFKLSNNGIKKIFGREAKNYMDDNKGETELDKTITALTVFSDLYESNSVSRHRKHEQLVKEEEGMKGLSFVDEMKNAIKKSNHRFFLYDCTKDFLEGEKSSLCRTLNDLYGHDENYFTELRLFLDEKHPLLTMGFLDIDKNEVIEQTTISLGDKTIDLLYGNNSDLYKKTCCAKNVLAPETLKEKQLFYSAEVQKQIDMLTQSFNQEKLEEMQKRLEQKALPKGIAVLLYGAPGTGKTETAFQLAKKTNRKILHVDIAESKSMWFGESEKRIKKIFTDYARLCKDCKRHKENTPILLFNEADALISKRKDVTSGNVAQTENAMQNILLEQLEKLDGIMIATTNLCENMDSAFERRFLFKVKYEKPSLQARTNIWMNKMPKLAQYDAERLAGEFDFSGGEIDNIVRKCEMNEIISGSQPAYEELVELCKNERLEKQEGRSVGFRY